MRARGDTLIEVDDGPNYLVFAHRYRGQEDYSLEMTANLNNVIWMIQNLSFAELGDKSIVIVSSINAAAPTTTQSLAYNVSKAALNQVARYLAKTQPIRINTVSPATFTGDHPDVTAQEVANVIAFLCSPAASGINGADIRVTGRMK